MRYEVYDTKSYELFILFKCDAHASVGEHPAFDFRYIMETRNCHTDSDARDPS